MTDITIPTNSETVHLWRAITCGKPISYYQARRKFAVAIENREAANNQSEGDSWWLQESLAGTDIEDMDIQCGNYEWSHWAQYLAEKEYKEAQKEFNSLAHREKEYDPDDPFPEMADDFVKRVNPCRDYDARQALAERKAEIRREKEERAEDEQTD